MAKIPYQVDFLFVSNLIKLRLNHSVNKKGSNAPGWFCLCIVSLVQVRVYIFQIEQRIQELQNIYSIQHSLIGSKIAVR